ncbi:MAG: hypothetical protein NTX50_27465 [Candidatus Sumerlaeota bacterium]|nr:hypothetical protein [Candidatus Sumerlaeota bacterium]
MANRTMSRIGSLCMALCLLAFGAGWAVAQTDPSTPVATHTLTVLSVNPERGVPIAVQPISNGISPNLLTPFHIVYPKGTTVTLSAPPILGDSVHPSARFVKWLRNGLEFSGGTNPITKVILMMDHTMTAVYEAVLPPPPVTTHTLTVLSVNPERGVLIAVQLLPGGIQIMMATPFTQVFCEGTTVVLTAPERVPLAGGSEAKFVQWLIGTLTLYWPHPAVTVVMSADHQLTAVYEIVAPPQPTTHTLTVLSVNLERGVPIAVAPNPLAMPGNPATPFSIVYPSGTTVTLTAPAILGDDPAKPRSRFVKWLRNGREFDGGTNPITKVVLMMDHTMTAVYETVAPPPPPPVTTHTLTVDAWNHTQNMRLPGVPVAINPPDPGSLSPTRLTPFTNVYPENTTITLTAPERIPMASGCEFRFLCWVVDGRSQSWKTPQVTILLSADYYMEAMYVAVLPPPPVTTHTLMVFSINPQTGVPIMVAPLDPAGAANSRLTPFHLVYPEGTTVTLTAPERLPMTNAGEARFVRWMRSSSDTEGWPKTQVTVIMSEDHQLTAVYETTPPPPPPSKTTHTLTVLSANPERGVPIAMMPMLVPSGPAPMIIPILLTPFSLVYPEGTTVTLTAPQVLPSPAGAIPGRFVKWLRNGNEFRGGTNPMVQVVMNEDIEMTAVYEGVTPPPPPPPPSKTTHTLTVLSANPERGVPIAVMPIPAPNPNPTPNPSPRPSPNPSPRPSPNPSLRPSPNPSPIPSPRPSLNPASNPAPNSVPIPNILLTPFSFAYPEGTTVTLTAPQALPNATGTVAGKFAKWLRNGAECRDGMNPTVQVVMNEDCRMTAVYESVTPPPPPPPPVPPVVTTHTLTLASSNPDSGVEIRVAPLDASSIGGRLTPCDLVYAEKTQVTLTAPASAPLGGGLFVKWLKDGADFAGNSALMVSVAMDADYTMTAVFADGAAANQSLLTLDSAVPDCSIAITVMDPSVTRGVIATFNGTRAGVFDNSTTITLTVGAASDNRYTFRKWLRNGREFHGNQSASIEILLDGNVTMTAVYASNWFEDYLISYTDNAGHKFNYPETAAQAKVRGLAAGATLSAENGLALQWSDMTSGTMGALTIKSSRQALASGKAPRPIPGIKTNGALARVWSQGSVACKGAGTIEAMGAIRSLAMPGAYAMNLVAPAIGVVRMQSRPSTSSICVTSIHATPGALLPPLATNARQIALADISLIGVSLGDLALPGQPVSIMTQTRRYTQPAPVVCEAGIGVGGASVIQAAVVARLTAIGGGIRCAAILSHVPATAARGVSPYPNKDVSIITRALAMRNAVIPANIAVREINVEGNLRVCAEGGDIDNLPAPVDALYTARIIAGGRILGISASTAGPVGGYIGARPASNALATTQPAPIAVVAGANATSDVTRLDIAAIAGMAGVNGAFFAGAAVADDPSIEIMPADRRGNIGAIQSRARRPAAILGAAWLQETGAQRLARQLKAQGNVSGDFEINGKPLSQ